jgi:hypothetical protein
MLKLFSGNNTYMLAELDPKPHAGWFEDGHFYWQNSLQVQQVSIDKMHDVLSGSETVTKLGLELLKKLEAMEHDKAFAEAEWATLEDEADHARNVLRLNIWLTALEEEQKQKEKKA